MRELIMCLSSLTLAFEANEPLSQFHLYTHQHCAKEYGTQGVPPIGRTCRAGRFRRFQLI